MTGTDLRGRWTQWSTRAEPDNAGDIEFTLVHH